MKRLDALFRRAAPAGALLGLFALAGCATYANSARSQRLGADTALVSAQSERADEAVQFTLLRAAEETSAAGYDWFRIQEADGAGTVLTRGLDEVQRVLSPLDWCAPLCSVIGGLGPTPRAQVLIKMGKGAAPSDGYAASEIIANLGHLRARRASLR